MTRKRSKRARPWFVIDAETDPFQYDRVPEPFAWCAYGAKLDRVWWNDGETFAEWLATQDAIAYAHNGGRFDFHFLAKHFNPEKPIRIINGRIASVFVGECELRDSWLLCPIPLAAHEKTAIDYSLFESDRREAHREEITAYLRDDCVSLWRLLDAFHSEHPGLPLTLPSAAMKAMQALEGVKAARGSERFDAELRPWYFGGRCEAIRPGIFDPCALRSFDLNSAYPAAMLQAHWWGFHRCLDTRLPTDPERLQRCMAQIEATSEGALPLRVPGARLAYPRGERHIFHATGWEILAGLETGTLRIHRVLEVLEPLESQSFGVFVDHYWRAKEEAERTKDKARRHIAKITLNGCYGKFAQDPTEFLEWDLCDSIPPMADHWRHVSIADGLFHAIGRPSDKKRWYNVATAASITGCVRAQLWRAICASREVYYCDTDSILCAEPGFPIGRGIGEWKDEGSVSGLVVAGRKLYAAKLEGEWKVRSKGVKLSVSELFAIARGDTVEWKAEAPTFSWGKGVGFLKRNVRMRERELTHGSR